MFRRNFSALAVLLLLAPVSSYAQALAPYQVMHPLAGDEGSDPQSGLIPGADGLLYGTASCWAVEDNLGNFTYPCGPDVAGTIYRVSPDGTSFEVVHRFSYTTPNGGLYPAGLMRGRDKNLYGTTSWGGTAGDGVIYKLAWNRNTYSGVTVLHSFDCSEGEGGDPWGAPTEGPDGALYGITLPSDDPDPACASVSTLYRINKDGTGFEIRARFDYWTVGSHQFGSLVFGSDGSIYGTLVDANPSTAGGFQYGSIYRVSPQGDISYRAFQSSPIEGAYPFSGLTRGDGALYGTTLGGGQFGVGTIFKINEGLTGFSTLHSFKPECIHTPASALVAGGNGVLYGMAFEGGSLMGCGVVPLGPYGDGGSYIFYPPDHPKAGFAVHQFLDRDTTGRDPYGPLGVGGVDRHLYGTQWSGGAGGQGVLFGLGDIEVADRPPFPVALASPNPAEADSPQGKTVALSALGSWDPDFDDLTYSWELPSGATSAAPTINVTFPVGTSPVTLTVSNPPRASNQRSVTIQVVVRDTTKPTVVIPSDVTVEATGPSGADVSYAVTASDIVGVDSLVCSPFAAGTSTFPLGETVVTCTATDAAGNIGADSFTVTVRDTTPPVVTTPPDMTVLTTGTSAIVTYTPTASDLVGVVSFACVPPSGSTFPLGVTVVQCTATDAANNQGSGSFRVTVREPDLVAPVVTVAPTTLLAVAMSPAGALGSFIATALDNVDGSLPVTCTWPGKSVTFPRVGAVATSQLFPIGVTTVLCFARDAGNNIGTAILVVTVLDGPPVVTVPANITINAAANHTATVSFLASARDAIDGARPVTCQWGTAANVRTVTFAAGSTIPQAGVFAEGTTLVTCTGADLHGTSASATFTVLVTPPTTLGKFVAFSKVHTWLWARTRVLSGDVGANAKRSGFAGDDDDRDDERDEDDRFRLGAIEVRLGQAATMPNGSRVVGDTVWLQPHTSVYDVIDNNLIRRGATVHGTVTTGLSLPLMNLPALSANSPGTKDIVVDRNKTMILSEGQYRNITVKQNGTLVLTGGIYQVQSLNLGTRTTVRVMAAADVGIRGEFNAGSHVTINEPLSAVPARQVLFSVGGLDSDCRHGGSHHGHDDDDDDHGGDHDHAGPAAVHIGTRSTIKANIYAPRGTVWIQSKANATGAFIGDRVRIGVDSQLTLDSAF